MGGRVRYGSRRLSRIGIAVAFPGIKKSPTCSLPEKRPADQVRAEKSIHEHNPHGRMAEARVRVCK